MAGKKHQTLADFVVVAISPALIMALVGSLVFFLMEVLYVGEYGTRMRWILFCYVFGSVLIARMSMLTEIADRSGPYGLLLGGLVWYALQAFVEYAPGSPLAAWGWAVNLFLVGVTWWCAHRLTWDCTLIDDNVDASGEGLLQTVGWDEPAPDGGGDEPTGMAEADGRGKQKKKRPDDEGGLSGWWERYRRYHDACRRQPHTPGVWVVYFSLAALPIFGLGQSLIPSGELGRRRLAFWLMGVYVGSGLGLLMTTSFLGLRRYLRQRRLQMPAGVTAAWLTTGSLLALALLAGGALLPRPYPEYPLLNLGRLAGSPDREASWFSPGGRDAGKGEGRAGERTADDKQAGRQVEKKGGDPGAGKSRDDRGGGELKDKAGDGPQQKGREAKERPAEKDKSSKSADGNNGQPPSRETRWDVNLRVPEWLKTAARWFVYALLALGALYVLGRWAWSLLKFLAHFTHWARRLVEALRAWWQGLFGGLRSGREEAEDEEKEPARERSFAEFVNPFLAGADGRSVAALLRYSFAALEAFAREQGHAREPSETPLEFTARLAEDYPELEDEARRLAQLYARVAYADQSLPLAARESLRHFWDALESVARPVSATRNP